MLVKALCTLKIRQTSWKNFEVNWRPLPEINWWSKDKYPVADERFGDFCCGYPFHWYGLEEFREAVYENEDVTIATWRTDEFAEDVDKRSPSDLWLGIL